MCLPWLGGLLTGGFSTPRDKPQDSILLYPKQLHFTGACVQAYFAEMTPSFMREALGRDLSGACPDNGRSPRLTFVKDGYRVSNESPSPTIKPTKAAPLTPIRAFS